MSRPSAWIATAAVVVAAGAVITWSITSADQPRPRPTRVSAPSASSSATVESLREAPKPVVPPVSPKELVAAAEAAATPGMTLGVAVMDLTTGELVAGSDGERDFMSASLSKLITAVDVLDQHRAEGRPVAPEDLDLITRALASSDDNAMNALWGKHDGLGGVDRVATRLGLAATVPAGSAEMWGDTTVTAADMVTIYRHVLRGMAPQDGAVLVKALAATTPAATDGFGQHYGLLHQGASPRHYAKQAWVEYAPAGYLLHSAGVAYDGRTGHAYAIALLSIQPHTSDEQARARLSKVAAATMTRLTP